MKLDKLDTLYMGRSFLHLHEVDSTNNYVKQNMNALENGFVVAADYQNSGRGTRERKWISPDKKHPNNAALAFSVLIKDIPLQKLCCLSLIAGLAVCSAIRELTQTQIFIKWPNDIVAFEAGYNDGKKLCGILCESKITADTAGAVVGIGLNIAQTKEEFERLELVYAGSLLSVTNKVFLPEDLLCAILNKFEPLLAEYMQKGFDCVLRENYRKNCINIARSVQIMGNGIQYTARVLDINPDGSLLIENSGETSSIYAGDVSVRGIYGYTGLA